MKLVQWAQVVNNLLITTHSFIPGIPPGNNLATNYHYKVLLYFSTERVSLKICLEDASFKKINRQVQGSVINKIKLQVNKQTWRSLRFVFRAHEINPGLLSIFVLFSKHDKYITKTFKTPLNYISFTSTTYDNQDEMPFFVHVRFVYPCHTTASVKSPVHLKEGPALDTKLP